VRHKFIFDLELRSISSFSSPFSGSDFSTGLISGPAPKDNQILGTKPRESWLHDRAIISGYQ
jgi:hypothetical protein